MKKMTRVRRPRVEFFFFFFFNTQGLDKLCVRTRRGAKLLTWWRKWWGKRAAKVVPRATLPIHRKRKRRPTSPRPSSKIQRSGGQSAPQAPHLPPLRLPECGWVNRYLDRRGQETLFANPYLPQDTQKMLANPYLRGFMEELLLHPSLQRPTRVKVGHQPHPHHTTTQCEPCSPLDPHTSSST